MDTIQQLTYNLGFDGGRLQGPLRDQYDGVVAMLEVRVGDANRRLSSGPVTSLGDQYTAELTYGDIVLRHGKFNQQDSPALHEGARKVKDPELIVPLLAGHLRLVDDYITTRELPPRPRELGGEPVVELQDLAAPDRPRLNSLNPKVESYRWMRGLVVAKRTLQAMIFRPPLTTSIPEGSIFPVMYTVGRRPPGAQEFLRAVVSDYVTPARQAVKSASS